MSSPSVNSGKRKRKGKGLPIGSLIRFGKTAINKSKTAMPFLKKLFKLFKGAMGIGATVVSKLYVQLRPKQTAPLAFYEAKLLFSEGRGRT